MKILHVSAMGHLEIGIVNQLSCEVSAIKELNNDWETVAFSNNHIGLSFHKTFPIGFKGPLGRRLFIWIYIFSKRNDYDYIIHRFVGKDLWAILFSKLIRNRISIHHSISQNEINTSTFLGKFKFFMDSYLTNLQLRHVKGLIGVTSELTNHYKSKYNLDCPSTSIPNGISTDANYIDKRVKTHNILFVASRFVPWHGLEFLLDSIIDKETKERPEYKLHLVGTLTKAQEYIIQKNTSLNDVIKIHGILDKQQLSEILNEMDVGLSCFNLAYKNVNEACTLKVREYLNAGVPVYAGHKDTGIPVDFDFYMNGIADIDNILAFSKSMKLISRSEVNEKSKPFIDKKHMILNIISFLQSIKQK